MATKRISELDASAALDGSELLEVSQKSADVSITAATISAAAADNSFNDSGGGFITEGFAVGDRVTVAGFADANNIVSGAITELTAGKMTIGGTDGDVIVDEAAGPSVTIAKWVTRRATAQDIADLGGGGGGGGVGPLTVSGQTANYTAVLADADDYIRMNLAGAGTFTVPANASVAFPVGTRLYVEQRGAGVVTITPDTGVTIRSRGSVYNTGGQYAVAALVKVDTDTWVLSGDLA